MILFLDCTDHSLVTEAFSFQKGTIKILYCFCSEFPDDGRTSHSFKKECKNRAQCTVFNGIFQKKFQVFYLYFEF